MGEEAECAACGFVRDLNRRNGMCEGCEAYHAGSRDGSEAARVATERETIARVVAWLRANRPGEPTAVRFGHYFADALERGDWKGGDDGR